MKLAPPGRFRLVRIVLFLVLTVAACAHVLAFQSEASADTSMVRQPGYLLEDHLDQAKLAILPLGAIEFHGPSGPLLTDSIIAQGLAARLAPQVNASLLPVLSYTHAPAHSAAYRGTLSVRPHVVTEMVTDILRGLVSAGFDKILVLNGHDGNIGPARAAISLVTQEAKHTQMALVSWWQTLPGEEVEAMDLFTSGNGGHGHGGPLELSVAAVFAPDSVVPGKGPDLPALQGQASFPYYLEKSDVTGWPGYSGKLSEISASKGERLVEVSLGKLKDFVSNWLKNDKQPGSW
ncbi:MAG TPA: creatininase family protein [Acidobacteriota bacterium]|nr:creatininase family protein [Acidobacteriota bacterium]